MRSRWLLLALIPLAFGTPDAQEYELRRYRDSCSRDRVELMFALSAAVESGNVNRIAALYDWHGMGATASRRVMDRLEGLAGRTLVDVVPVFPPDRAGLDGDWLSPPVARDPVGLRVLQVLGDGATPVATTFRVHDRMGCWWVAF